MRLKALTLFLISLSAFSMQALAEDPDRKAELARIEREIQVQKDEAEKAAAELLPRQKILRQKVAQKEKTLRDLTRRKRITKPAAQALEKLRGDLSKLDSQIKRRQQPFIDRQGELEQDRRQILKRFPEAGDPTYLEVEGKLYTQDEWTLEKSRYPGSVAEEYIQELIRSGTIRSAKYTKTTQHAMSLDRASDGLPVHDFLNVNYTVQYVSKGGVLNERNVWVTVVTIDGEHWLVSQMMKELEVLGGLP